VVYIYFCEVSKGMIIGQNEERVCRTLRLIEFATNHCSFSARTYNLSILRLSFNELSSEKLIVDFSLMDPRTMNLIDLCSVSLLFWLQKLLHKESLLIQLLVSLAKGAVSRKPEKLIVVADNKHFFIIDGHRINQTTVRKGRINLPFEFISFIKVLLRVTRIHGKHQAAVHHYGVNRNRISFFNSIVQLFSSFPFFENVIFMFWRNHLYSFTDAGQFNLITRD